MNTLSATDKEDIRHAVLEAMAVRHPAALSPRQIQRAVKKDIPFLFEESDVDSALEVLKGFGLADFTPDELGSTKYWRATSAGVLKFERA